MQAPAFQAQDAVARVGQTQSAVRLLIARQSRRSRFHLHVDPRLHPAAARSMLAAIIHLERGGDVEAGGPPGPETVYRLA